MNDINTWRWPFTNAETTEAVNLLPNVYGKIGGLGLFPVDAISSTVARVDIKDGTVSVMGASDRGAPPNQTLSRDEEGIKLVQVPHFPGRDRLTPDDIQDKFLFGTNSLRTVQSAANDFLAKLRMQHDITLEYLRMTALKGQLRDGFGKLLLDSYSLFGVTKKIVYFDLANDAVNPRTKTYEILRYMEDNLRGETMTGARVEVAPDFMDTLIDHPMVREAFYYASAGRNVDDVRKNFSYGGVTFSEYNASVSLRDGTSARLIEPGFGHAFPVGMTQGTDKTYAAPAHRMGAVNRPGSLIDVSVLDLDHGSGIEFDHQMNGLPIFRRPALLVECRKGADPG